MATAPNSTLFASSRRTRSLGLAIAAGVLLIATVGGGSALVGAYTGAVAQTPVVAVQHA